MSAPELIDAALETLIVPSFTRIGLSTRRHLFSWRSLDSYDLSGRVVAITGATSGLGRAAAVQMAHDRATVIVLGRNRDKTERVAAEIRTETGNPDVSATIGEMSDLTPEAAREAVET
ncbi:MAG: SDR family NAD(P)-dependent oxidoreductase, partial [Acidimicrobiia bacterium]